MTDDKLSKEQDQRLQSALESVLLTRFPNPERKGCPGTATLRAIARKKLSMRDPAIDHVGNCSPCFAELQEMRKEVRRKRVLWAVASATASVIILIAVLGNLGILTPARTDLPQTATVLPREPVLLDLRNFSPTRGEISSGGTPTSNELKLQRGALALTIQLPIGTEEGTYELELGPTTGPAVLKATGNAKIQDGLTTLVTEIDTTSVPPGQYQLALRQAGFSWRYYPIAVR